MVGKFLRRYVYCQEGLFLRVSLDDRRRSFVLSSSVICKKTRNRIVKGRWLFSMLPIDATSSPLGYLVEQSYGKD